MFQDMFNILSDALFVAVSGVLCAAVVTAPVVAGTVLAMAADGLM